MQQDNSANNKRIAKNTLYMYVRMGVIMLVQLYTSRVVLNALGVEDYGIYNVVGAFIVAFTFISGPLGTATQRFLNFELGKKERGNVDGIFSMSLLIYFILVLLLFVIIEIVGLWFMYNKMQLPDNRFDAALWAFHTSVISLCIGLLKTPFESLIIAHERMSFYAYMGIIEALFKLVNAWSLLYITIDKLVLYSFNQLLISIIIFYSFYFFCRKTFTQIKIKLQKDKALFKELMSFSGWSLFGSMANMTADQGLNIILNLFFGVVINAAMGIANQVNASINQFVSNFQIAFRPQLVKHYAAGKMDELHLLIQRTSRFSFLLLFAVACPICFNIHFILELWLKKVPDYADIFCILIIVYSLFSTLSAPLWITVHATGKIKNYQIVISCIILSNIIISYGFLKYGYSPQIVLVTKCFVGVVCVAIRLFYVSTLVNFSISAYIKETIVPLLTISIASIIIVSYCTSDIEQGWYRILISVVSFMVPFALLTIAVGLNKSERKIIVNYIKQTYENRSSCRKTN